MLLALEPLTFCLAMASDVTIYDASVGRRSLRSHPLKSRVLKAQPIAEIMSAGRQWRGESH